MFFAGFAIVSWLLFLVVSGYPVFAWVYYQARPDTSTRLAEILGADAGESPGEMEEREEVVLPPRDESLSEGQSVTIPNIGVDGEIYEAPLDNYESALRKGIWRVPNFATPETTNERPMILVAHRFGYLEWSNAYRRENSFFNINKLEEGAIVEVVWDKRLYKYEIELIEEGEDISSYDYDLIVYTCKFLVSPIRIFAYASRIN